MFCGTPEITVRIFKETHLGSWEGHKLGVEGP